MVKLKISFNCNSSFFALLSYYTILVGILSIVLVILPALGVEWTIIVKFWVYIHAVTPAYSPSRIQSPAKECIFIVISTHPRMMPVASFPGSPAKTLVLYSAELSIHLTGLCLALFFRLIVYLFCIKILHVYTELAHGYLPLHKS